MLARVMVVAERWAEAKRQDATIVPVADWARQSTLPTRCTTIARMILGAFAVVLVMGGFYVVSKTNHRQHPAVAEGPRIDAPVTGDRTTMLLEAMKEELFQLED